MKNNRDNNFDFLRLILASLVIVTHSYPIAGISDFDVLSQLTNNQLCFSYIGVSGFFVISGYLVFQSFERSHNAVEYYVKRLLRLYPGLFVMLILTAGVLVPIVYQGNTPLLENTSYMTYIPNNLKLYGIQYNISGVFENNPYKSAINVSLWTLAIEFNLYVLLSFLFIIKKHKKLLRIILSIVCAILMCGNILLYDKVAALSFTGKVMLEFGCFFFVGSLVAAFSLESILKRKVILILSVLALIVSLYFNVFSVTKCFTLPLIILPAGLMPIRYISKIGSYIGDLSYGIYIYGCPVQQTIMYYFQCSTTELMISSLLVSSMLAYMSWHLVEKRALHFKQYKKLFRHSTN
jgi:peptidoglycan/LPS O-acetylase OafA/YrhL